MRRFLLPLALLGAVFLTACTLQDVARDGAVLAQQADSALVQGEQVVVQLQATVESLQQRLAQAENEQVAMMLAEAERALGSAREHLPQLRQIAAGAHERLAQIDQLIAEDAPWWEIVLKVLGGAGLTALGLRGAPGTGLMALKLLEGKRNRVMAARKILDQDDPMPSPPPHVTRQDLVHG
jgi:ElaB/YqjD/DUF883 family membrane-anchored ribosome-binding protein